MFEAKVINDIEGTRLCLACNKQLASGYEVKMFEYNKIPGFVEMTCSRMNNIITYQYSTSGLKELTKVYDNKEIGLEDIRSIFIAISNITELTYDYLLSPNNIILDPQYIYMTKDEYRFCYYPGSGEIFSKGIRLLMEYILERLDHSDKENVLVAYGLYQKLLKNDYTMEELLQAFCEFDSKNVSMITTNEEKRTIIENRIELATADRKEYEKEYRHEDKIEYSQDKKEYSQDDKIEYGNRKENVCDIFSLEKEIENDDKKVGIFSKATKEQKQLGQRKQEKQQEKQQKSQKQKAWFFGKKKSNTYDTGRYGKTVLIGESSNYGVGNYGATVILTGKVLRNQGVGSDIIVRTFPSSVGSNQGNADNKIDNIMVSRNHAVLLNEAGLYYVEDQGSTNGTFVNGSQISAFEPTQIKSGDSISFANEVFRFD